MAKNLPQSTSRSGGELSRRGQSYGPMSLFHDEMDRLFDRFFGGLSWPSWRGEGGFLSGDGDVRVPDIDLTENDKEYCVEADLPGLDEKDISLTLDDGVLTLKAERSEEKKDEQTNYHVAERRWHSVQRALRLPEDIDQGKVSAEFKKGVLTVHLPKSPESHKSAKKIAIKSA
jgi:HSP20 family protein